MERMAGGAPRLIIRCRTDPRDLQLEILVLFIVHLRTASKTAGVVPAGLLFL